MAPCSLPRAGFAAPHLLDHGGCANHQHAAQGLVAGAGDRSEPGFAGCRVILWGQPDPRREISAGSEGLRLADFHDQQRGADRPDAGDLRQPPAGFIVAVPGHQLGFDRLQLRLQPGILRGVVNKQLACQCGQRRLGLQARQQRFDLVDAARRDQPKLRRIAANRIGQLGAAADSRSRVPASICAACCSAVLAATNRIVGRLIASHSASASAASFLPRLT